MSPSSLGIVAALSQTVYSHTPTSATSVARTAPGACSRMRCGAGSVSSARGADIRVRRGSAIGTRARVEESTTHRYAMPTLARIHCE